MGNKPHILLAVDNLQSARPLRALLEDGGYSTEWRPLNEAALASSLRRPDLWIFDTLLLDNEEMKAFHAIRDREGWEDVPVLAIATIIDGESHRKIRLLAADEIITKPIDPAELMLKAKSLLGMRSLEVHAQEADSTDQFQKLVADDPIANLGRIVARQSSGQNLETLLVQLLRYVRRLADYDDAFICAEAESGRYRVIAYVGGGTSDLATFYELGQSCTGWLAVHKEPLLVRDFDNEHRVRVWGRDQVRNRGLNSFAGLPLVRHGHVVGTLELGCYQRGAYGEEIFEVLRPVADVAALAIANARLRKGPASQTDLLAPEVPRLRHENNIIFRSPALERIIKGAHRVKDSQCSVLITGETGTGKELIARYIHQESKRRQFPFVDLNCSAVPESLQESELFGIEKGIATGVEKHIGKFEATGKGVLFLDEVAYMPQAMQAKMLRVLQERAFTRVGSHKEHQFHGRVIAATSRDLIHAIKEQSFREELYYRLAVVHLHLPPLRERPEDIPYLVGHFVQLFCIELERSPLKISPDTMAAFVNRDWPGNVRELRNAVERSVLFSQGSDLEVTEESVTSYPGAATHDHAAVIMDMAFEERLTAPDLIERYARHVYERMGRNKARTCDYLQINYRTLRKRLANSPKPIPALDATKTAQQKALSRSAAES